MVPPAIAWPSINHSPDGISVSPAMSNHDDCAHPDGATRGAAARPA
jgi:hypothetical protein